MFCVRRTAILALGVLLSLSACGGKPSGTGDERRDPLQNPQSIHLVGLLAPDTLSDFEKQTGIKVHAAYFDTNETLETKLLAGSSGFDIVVPTASYLERQIKAGAFCRSTSRSCRT